jgi:hypothetical protein
MSIRHFSDGPEHQPARKKKITDTFTPDAIIVGDFKLVKHPYDKLVIFNAEGECMEITAKKFAAVVQKFWNEEF